MLGGVIVSNISNTYIVEVNNALYECSARGKFKNSEIMPVVGDKVSIEIIAEEKDIAVINKVFDRKNYIKRPKLANLTKLVFVISSKHPKPDLLLLDKQLAFAEFLGIEAIIVINKIDLEKIENIEHIRKIYTDIGYKVILTNAKTGQGVEQLKKELYNNISAFSGNSGVRKIYTIKFYFYEEYFTRGHNKW